MRHFCSNRLRFEAVFLGAFAGAGAVEKKPLTVAAEGREAPARMALKGQKLRESHAYQITYWRGLVNVRFLLLIPPMGVRAAGGDIEPPRRVKSVGV